MRATQGVYPPSTFGMLGIPPAWYSSVEWQYPPHERQGAYEEEGRAINTLKVRVLSLRLHTKLHLLVCRLYGCVCASACVRG